LYKKEIRINGKKYTYYYYNLREGSKVKNVCLGRDRKIAKQKEDELKGVPLKIQSFPVSGKNLLEGAPNPFKQFEFGVVGRVLLIMFIILFGFGLFYTFNGLTGFVVYNDNIVLDVDNYVSSDAIVFLTVNLEEYTKSISEFGIEPDENG